MPDVDGVGLAAWGGKWVGVKQGWCACWCHGVGDQKAAVVSLEGFMLCRVCADLQIQELTGMPFIDYVSVA